MRLTGKQTWVFQNNIFVNATGTAVGPKEAEGPLGKCFDISYDELHCQEENWELAERRLMNDSIQQVMQKGDVKPSQIDFLLAGDLLNQTVTANYVARELGIPLLGMFSACATSMETLAIGSAFIDGGFANRVIATVSSHNATAERQFRYPTEYGGQRPGTATSTVTGAGAVLISKEQSNIKVTAATIGVVQDLGIADPFDMGSAMAPAAAHTIQQHFEDLGRSAADYDLIVTGDLSGVGAPITKQLLLEEGYDLGNVYNDCGLMIYYGDQEEVFAGGSGCACSAVVTYGHLLKEMQKGNLQRIFVVATGALLSPIMIQQKETIPTIAHGVVFERVKGV
ncbi:stage V sporulation protein AD [Bacillus cereus]|uniref:stage V sporulation protein AD n=1 Tax=Bacillus TaxID=1386 RepID=UPI00047AFDC0|nr:MULTISPECIES: stage V sporulation protein AD [Bacillus]PFE05743.1 stage V sporulation protein AD [Bacillus sp. AFS023182]PGY04390.1 stage V sporulation protein AD [Bacillus cereus]WIY60114.1 stage V sporulation protein AD [Bacillus arachidis]SDY47328.1 stage V sporulation protein AD [Bacillus sp. 166amftsu]